MNDNLTMSMEADYKVYELRTIIEAMEELAKCPAGLRTMNAQFKDIKQAYYDLGALILKLERVHAAS